MNHESEPQAGNQQELWRRRSEIERGLARAGRAALVALLVVMALACAALWQAHQARRSAAAELSAKLAAERARLGKEDQLWKSRLLEARSFRISGRPGQQARTFEVLRKATAQKPSSALRNEAIAALLLPDIGRELHFHAKLVDHGPMAVDPTGEFFLGEPGRPEVEVCRWSDGRAEISLPGFGPVKTWMRFSPDGRYVAAQMGQPSGVLAVWEWRTSRLVLRAPTTGAYWNRSTFEFSPDSRLVFAVSEEGPLRQFDLEQGRELAPLAPNAPAALLTVSRDGRLIGVAKDREARIFDRSENRWRDRIRLPDEILTMAIHPNGDRLAFGCYNVGALVWDADSPQPVAMSHQVSTVTRVFFNRDGDLLVASGWGDGTTFWDMSTFSPLLTTHEGFALEFAAEGRRLAFARERAGFGLWEFLPAAGLRRFLFPSRLGNQADCADLNSTGTRLLSGHAQGWALWNLEAGGLIAAHAAGRVSSIAFDRGDRTFLTGGANGLERWTPNQEAAGSPSGYSAADLFPERTSQAERFALSADRRTLAAVGPGGAFAARLDGEPRDLTLQTDGPHRTFVAVTPDGLTAFAATYNRPNLDVLETRSGRRTRLLETPGWTVLPCPDAPLALVSDPKGHVFLNLHDGQPGPWPALGSAASTGLDPVGFSPDGRILFLIDRTGRLHLRDVRRGADVAILEHPSGTTGWSLRFDARGRRAALNSTRDVVLVLDFGVLREGLAQLGLDWADADPGGGVFPAGNSLASQRETDDREFRSVSTAGSPGLTTGIILGGMLLAIGFGLYMLRAQRSLFLAYGELDRLAEARAAELIRTQSALLHSEKMKALGTLSAGVAHEFNNLLSVIRLSNELIEEQVRPTGLTQENVNAIQQAVQRGRGIVNSMLGYARDDSEPRRFSAAELLSETVALLGKSFLRGLVLQVEVQPDTPAVFARKGRVEQMYLNLIVNAAEAMEGRGTLALRARPAREPGHCLLPPAPALGFVELVVQDSGPGIPPELLPHIFEPFFTTKNQGSQRGTGLGLSMLYAMARDDGIGVGVVTQPGRGALFRLLLAQAPADSPNAADNPGRDSPVASIA